MSPSGDQAEHQEGRVSKNQNTFLKRKREMEKRRKAEEKLQRRR